MFSQGHLSSSKLSLVITQTQAWRAQDVSSYVAVVNTHLFPAAGVWVASFSSHWLWSHWIVLVWSQSFFLKVSLEISMVPGMVISSNLQGTCYKTWLNVLQKSYITLNKGRKGCHRHPRSTSLTFAVNDRSSGSPWFCCCWSWKLGRIGRQSGCTAPF